MKPIEIERTIIISSVPGIGEAKKPLLLTIEYDGSFWTIFSDDLNVAEGSYDLKTAMRDFFEYLKDDYCEWKRVDESELTVKAKRLKNKFLQYFG
jgi:hypothetical protein